MPIWPKACAYTVDNASDTINENAAEGFDTINSSVTKTIPPMLRN